MPFPDCTNTSHLPLSFPDVDIELQQPESTLQESQQTVVPSPTFRAIHKNSLRCRPLIFFSTRHYSLLLLTVCCVSTVTCFQQKIPGCYDIEQIDELINLNNASIHNLLFCFCKVNPELHVAINCLYGSTLDDLRKTISLINDVNATVEEVRYKEL